MCLLIQALREASKIMRQDRFIKRREVVKKKILIILGCLLMLSLIGPGISQAFTVVNVDGVWGKVNGVTTTNNYYPVDIIGYAREGEMAPLRNDQTYRLKENVCTPMQNITPPWPNAARWDQVPGVDWTGVGSHSSTCANAPDLFFSEYVYVNRSGWLATDYVGIEIANRTGSAVQLSDYDVLLFSGERTYTRVALNTKLLGHGDVYVLVSRNASDEPVHYDQRFTASDNYRTIVLVKNTTTSGNPHTEGARCDRWGTGPGNTPLVYSDWDPSVQTGPTDDENQVRYGRDAFNPSSWKSYSCEITDWAEQSGFGFDGVNGPLTPASMVPFLLGQFTHYNNQVYASDDTGQSSTNNQFYWVDLTITVPVTCNDGAPANPSSFSFTPHFVLDETPNSTPCEYTIGPNDVPCPDKVTIEFPHTNPTFQCSDGTYTVNILGFTSKGLGNDDCTKSYNPDAVSAAFITAEDAANHACLWARIEQPLADISVAKTCWDFDSQNPYYEITTSNLGPGASRGVTMTDTLPSGMTYKSYTSQLITTSGTIDQGTCNVAGQIVSCSLNTPLQDYTTDPKAKWVVKIYVNYASGTDKTNTAEVSALTTDPDETNNTATATCNPSAVSIIAFDAKSAEDGVLLTWETASELNNLGFNLYRATKPALPGLRLNPSLIPGHNPGSTSGAVYEFLDATAVPGFEYFYWLEDVDFGFNPTLYGPISVTQ